MVDGDPLPLRLPLLHAELERDLDLTAERVLFPVRDPVLLGVEVTLGEKVALEESEEEGEAEGLGEGVSLGEGEVLPLPVTEIVKRLEVAWGLRERVGRPAVGELEREGEGERVDGMEKVRVLTDDCEGDKEAEGHWDEEDVIERDAGGEEPKGEREGKPLDLVALVTGDEVLLPSVLGEMGPEEEGVLEGEVEKDGEEEVEEDRDTEGV